MNLGIIFFQAKARKIWEKNNHKEDFSGGAMAKNSLAMQGNRFEPSFGKILHVSEKLSPRATAIKAHRPRT